MVKIKISNIEYMVDILHTVYRMSINFSIKDPVSGEYQDYSYVPKNFTIKNTDQWTYKEFVKNITYEDCIIGECSDEIKSKFSLSEMICLTDFDSIPSTNLPLQNEGRYTLPLNFDIRNIIVEGYVGEWEYIKSQSYGGIIEQRIDEIKQILGEI